MGVSSTRDRPFWDKNKPEPSYTRCLRRMLKSRKKKRVFCTAPTRRKQNIRRPEGTPRQMCSQLHTVVHSQLQSNIHWPSSGELVFKQSIRSSWQTGSILQEENKTFSDAYRLSMQIRASRACRNQTHRWPDHAEFHVCALRRAQRSRTNLELVRAARATKLDSRRVQRVFSRAESTRSRFVLRS